MNIKKDSQLPVGQPVNAWQTLSRPTASVINGQYCRLERLDPSAHAKGLYDAIMLDTEAKNWTYLPSERPTNFNQFNLWLIDIASKGDPRFYAVIDPNNDQAIGIASLMRINPEMGSIEVGYILFSPLLQQTTASTEAIYLMMKYTLDELRYRRFEWKCDQLNIPSMKAAKRFGFTFEGVHRQAMIYKQRNRDTAWFSILDSEWPAIKAGFERWLAADNFDSNKVQIKSLSQCRDI